MAAGDDEMSNDTLTSTTSRPLPKNCSESARAEKFLSDVRSGAQSFDDLWRYETIYGRSDGFVYFIGIGEPAIARVKVGYTKRNPFARLDGLQTGSAFEMKMLGFVFGTRIRERELHDVLRFDRLRGEWFEYSNHVAKIIHDELTEEPYG